MSTLKYNLVLSIHFKWMIYKKTSTLCVEIILVWTKNGDQSYHCRLLTKNTMITLNVTMSEFDIYFQENLDEIINPKPQPTMYREWFRRSVWERLLCAMTERWKKFRVLKMQECREISNRYHKEEEYRWVWMSADSFTGPIFEKVVIYFTIMFHFPVEETTTTPRNT